jgi:hypothetical protein
MATACVSSCGVNKGLVSSFLRVLNARYFLAVKKMRS